jgi:hypothetical protein
MIRTNVLAIRIALVACSIATFFSVLPARAQAPAGQAPGAPAQAAQGRGGRGQVPQTPQAQAPIDLTGWWVSVVTEDWRWRMVTPAKGDYASVPINDVARRLADTWDPAKDEREGNACKAYGVAGIMRVPGRLHITWQDESTLKIETDAGTQTRLLHFTPSGESTADVALGLRAAAAPPPTGEQGWQGYSVATWEILNPPARGNPLLGGAGTAPAAGADGGAAAGGGPDGARGGGRGRAGNAPPVRRYGSLKVVTTKMKPGYLRKNGVPYSENATVSEYFDRHKESNGDEWLTVTTLVEDPKYLNQPFTTSSHFKKEPDGSKWRPTPCAAQ